MSRLPALGPRGEGWLVGQLAIFWAIFTAGLVASGQVSGLAAALALVAGGLLVACGLALAVAGVRSLAPAGSFTALPRPRPGSRLVDSGVYARVRHPIYGGVLVAALGWGLARASLAALAATALLAAFFVLKSSREEAWLAERHPEYVAYRRRTKRLIPGLF
jgi:protein-S-isoprenylcysteine O-methyltransferase Ste14